jgi:hypothetical protein
MAIFKRAKSNKDAQWFSRIAGVCVHVTPACQLTATKNILIAPFSGIVCHNHEAGPCQYEQNMSEIRERCEKSHNSYGVKMK